MLNYKVKIGLVPDVRDLFDFVENFDLAVDEIVDDFDGVALV